MLRDIIFVLYISLKLNSTSIWMFLLQISRVFLLTCNGLMFCEVNAEELTGMQCLFLLFPMETYFLWTIIRRCYLLLSLLVVCLSHCLLSFLQNSILGLFFLGDPSSCPCFKPQREEISKAEMWDRCVLTPHLLMCCSALPFPDISCRQECLMDLGMYIPVHIVSLFSLFLFFKWAT